MKVQNITPAETSKPLECSECNYRFTDACRICRVEGLVSPHFELEQLTCCACGYKGPGVRYESVHIGGQGEVLKPRCFNLDECDARRSK